MQSATTESLPHRPDLMFAIAMPLIRDATITDLPGILAITNQAILYTTAIWSITPFDLAARTQWWRDRLAANCPVLVAENAGDITAFGSFGQFRPHDGYLHTVEHSIYVAPEAQGQGIGKALLLTLIDRAVAAGKHAMIGGIDATNERSLALHRKLGFTETGRLPEVGRKFDRWLDLVLMQRRL